MLPENSEKLWITLDSISRVFMVEKENTECLKEEPNRQGLIVSDKLDE